MLKAKVHDYMYLVLPKRQLFDQMSMLQAPVQTQGEPTLPSTQTQSDTVQVVVARVIKLEK